jgi:hypothetical protein
MKRLVLIAVVALLTFSSCTKKESIILTEKIPELKGEWVWTHSVVGGVVGVVHADSEKKLVIDFKDNNTISVKYDGETIVNKASYTCKGTPNSPYGNYLITLPKEVRSKVAESLGISESHIAVDGYILLDDDTDELPAADNLTLYIYDVEGRDMGVEGGSDFHCCSGFVLNTLRTSRRKL